MKPSFTQLQRLLGAVFLLYLGLNAEPATKRTAFGTVLWGRNSTGNPHWMDASVFPGVDGQSRLENMIYVPLDPFGKPAATSSDPEKLARGNYDCARLDYWVDQAKQMGAAGLDWVAIDSFGDRKDLEEPGAAIDPKKDKYIFPSMAKGIREARVKLKICLLDDTPSHTLYDYRYELLRKSFPGSNAEGRANWLKYRWDYKTVPVVPLPVDAELGKKYLAGKWISAFHYLANDKDLWFTHNGRLPSEGGRPVVFMYGANGGWMDKTMFSNWHLAFAAAKSEFKKTHGVEPFLLLDAMYFEFDPHVAEVADGKWIWAPIAGKTPRARTGTFTNAQGQEVTAGMVMPGFELRGKEISHIEQRRRFLAMDGTEGDEKHLLTTEFQQVMSGPKPDFVIIGHWNDFQEGQNWGMGIYPTKDGKGFLPPDYYLKAVRNLIDLSRR